MMSPHSGLYFYIVLVLLSFTGLVHVYIRCTDIFAMHGRKFQASKSTVQSWDVMLSVMILAVRSLRVATKVPKELNKFNVVYIPRLYTCFCN